MKLTPLNLFANNSCKANATSQSVYYRTKPLKFDTVSFSAKNDTRENINLNSLKAFEIGDMVYSCLDAKKTKEEIAKKIKKQNPDLDVTALSSDKKSYDALFTVKCGFDIFDTTGPKMELKMQPIEYRVNNKKIYHLDFARDVAHEYTHYMQYKEKVEQYCLMEIANGDKEYASLVRAVGFAMFPFFDVNIKNMSAENIFNDDFIKKARQYGIEVPGRQKVTQEDILAKYGSKEEFDNFIGYMYHNNIQQCLKDALNDTMEIDEVNSRLIKHLLSKYLTSPDAILKFVQDTKKYCACLAKKEQEAWETESILINKILGFEYSNIDFYKNYYKLLNEAFLSKPHYATV